MAPLALARRVGFIIFIVIVVMDDEEQRWRGYRRVPAYHAGLLCWYALKAYCKSPHFFPTPFEEFRRNGLFPRRDHVGVHFCAHEPRSRRQVEETREPAVVHHPPAAQARVLSL